ncbi:MAG: hypothetical protein ACYCOO_04730 [Chitinophagaceae bacterium]
MKPKISSLMKYFYLFLVFTFFAAIQGWSRQLDTVGIHIPISRQLIHENIDQQQGEALRMNKKGGVRVDISSNPQLDEQIQESLTHQINSIQYGIETGNLDARHKMIYLIGLYGILAHYNMEVRYGRFNPEWAPQLIQNFSNMMQADEEGKSVAPYVKEVPYQVAEIALEPFSQNYGYRVGKFYIYQEYCQAHPENILPELSSRFEEFLNEPYTDTIIAMVAKKYPEQLYNYATSYTQVGNAIRRNKDTLVQAIVKIGQSPNSLDLLPFLDYLVSGKTTVDDLEKTISNRDAFFELSVNTLIDMRNRMVDHDTSIGYRAMLENVKVKSLHYIRLVNDLHESPDPVRFASVGRFSAPDLYELMINGEEEIYTSSYIGFFDEMLARMKPPHGDDLLMDVVFDRFKRFLTMAAGYNTLDTFLRTMAPDNATFLMKKFVSGLESTGDLEDAVDVADAFGSIKDPQLSSFLQHQVDQNFIRVQQEGDERGKVIYALLAKLFTSRESSGEDAIWTKDISQKLHLPPLDYVPFKSLIDDSAGRVYEEVFFYGDKDGVASYQSFMTDFPASDWRVVKKPYWVTITSTRGKPVTIYAKLPFPNNQDEDDKAMTEMSNHLDQLGIHPTVYIHRGHSYHVSSTIAELQNSAKVVMLGSCGGYNSLTGVLDVAPDAQIISSKQTGSMFVNEPIIRSIEETIREGKDLDWIPMWSHLEAAFRNSPHFNEMFEDYIPPYKNLGAIFIKAYRKLMQEKNLIQ